jgi:hypothetical protein
MGSFSIWHFFMGGLPLVVILTIAGVVLYFLLRKAPNAPATEKQSPAGEGEIHQTVPTAQRSTARKVIAITYLSGGLFGAVSTLPELNGVSLDFTSALAWSILLAQIAAAIYGGWQFWNCRPIGAQLLYWLSWSCVPVISFSLLSYWCAIGLALFPTIELAPGNLGGNFSLRFGYASELFFNPHRTGILLGVNAVALLFAVFLAKLLRQEGIPKWPLVLPNA